MGQRRNAGPDHRRIELSRIFTATPSAGATDGIPGGGVGSAAGFLELSVFLHKHLNGDAGNGQSDNQYGDQ